MGKLNVFNFVTLNGYFKGPNGDISWHKHGTGSDEVEFAEEGAGSDSILLFGRVTYEMMAGYWPSPEAKKNAPKVAEGMNNSEKYVFSRSMKKADWTNTTIIKENISDAVLKLKKTATKDITILGSGSIVTQLAESNLIDSYQFMMDPLAIGEGTSIFHGIKKPLKLKLSSTRTFKSGVILLDYEPVK
jgi:dihydrofolate reductase